MRKIIFFLLIVTLSISVYGQTDNLNEGDRCFDSGDYNCAVKQYQIAYDALKNTNDTEKKTADLKLYRAKKCVEHLKIAENAFINKNYGLAKTEYLMIYESNPKDNYVKKQIEKCNNALNPKPLRKATAEDLADIWNNKYGIQPERRQNLINAGIDPDDAQKRINAGEGKPQVNNNQSTKLSLSETTIYIPSNGGTSEHIIVYSDAKSYSIPSSFIPYWCKVEMYDGYFIVTVSPNPNNSIRKDWFKVVSGDKEVKIYIEQFAKISDDSDYTSSNKAQKNKTYKKMNFNYPKTEDTWGITLGYAQEMIDEFYYLDVLQFGVKVEPLFKYGFGMNSGINFMLYSFDLFSFETIENDFAAYALNIPLHLEYRFNFSKWFNVFIYGGFGLNAIITSDYAYYALPITFDFGSGLRINHVQFNLGRNYYIGGFNFIEHFGKYFELNDRLYLSISYMF
jgi:hypothetical protein